MKKLYTLFLLAFLSTHLSAQVIDYAAYSQVLSDTQKVVVADNSSFNTAWYSTIGNGVTWNASTITANAAYPVLNLSYHSPSATPYAGLYPSANYAFYDPALTVLLAYEYDHINSDSVVIEGSYSPSTAHEIYQDGDKRMIFPFSYGQSFNDSYAKTNYSDANTVSSYQTGTRDVSFNGFGTLILPQGTFSNVALITETRTNSIGPNSNVYTWLDITNGNTLMMYSINGSNIAVVFTTSLATGVNEIQHNASVVQFLNPSSESVTIQTSHNTDRIIITTTDGKCIFNKNPDTHEQTFHFHTKPGIYFVHVWSNNNHLVKKLIVQ